MIGFIGMAQDKYCGVGEIARRLPCRDGQHHQGQGEQCNHQLASCWVSFVIAVPRLEVRLLARNSNRWLTMRIFLADPSTQSNSLRLGQFVPFVCVR